MVNCLIPSTAMPQRQNGCLFRSCFYAPLKVKFATVSTAFGTKLTAHLSRSTSTASPHQLIEELGDCIADGNFVLGDLEWFKRTDTGAELTQHLLAVDVSGTQLEQFVRLVKAQHALATRIEKLVPQLFEEFCSDSPQRDEGEKGLPRERLLVRGISKLLDIVVAFDTLKASTPELQNVFSLYRRMNALWLVNFSLLSEQQADQLSLFLARPMPLFASLLNGVMRFIGRFGDRELGLAHLCGALIVIYNVLRHNVERKRCLDKMAKRSANKRSVFESPFSPTSSFLRSMVGLLLLFDHVYPNGVFSSKSPFDIRTFVQTVAQNAEKEERRQLLDTLRFHSKHFKGAQTPYSIRALFGR